MAVGYVVKEHNTLVSKNRCSLHAFINELEEQIMQILLETINFHALTSSYANEYSLPDFPLNWS